MTTTGNGFNPRQAVHVGVIGAGNIARRVHLPILSLIKGVVIDFVADVRDPSEIANLYHAKPVVVADDPAILPATDLAVLAIPVGVREPYIRELSKRGTAIFSEKPFALDTSMHLRLLDYSNRISCNYMRTCYSAARQAKAITESRMFGSLVRIDVNEGGIPGPTGKLAGHYQTSLELSGGGILLEYGSHTLSQLDMILEGSDFKVTSAEVIKQDGFDVDIRANVEAKGEQEVDLSYNLTSVRPVRTMARFTYERAELIYNHTRPDSLVRASSLAGGPSPRLTVMAEKSWAKNDNQAYYLRLNSFIDKIRKEKAVDTKEETSLATTEIISGIYHEAEKKILSV